MYQSTFQIPTKQTIHEVTHMTTDDCRRHNLRRLLHC